MAPPRRAPGHAETAAPGAPGPVGGRGAGPRGFIMGGEPAPGPAAALTAAAALLAQAAPPPALRCAGRWRARSHVKVRISRGRIRPGLGKIPPFPTEASKEEAACRSKATISGFFHRRQGRLCAAAGRGP